MQVTFHSEDAPKLSCRSVTGNERLGEASAFEIDLFSPEPVEAKTILGKPCGLVLENGFGARVVHGVVTRFAALATSQTASGRRYRVTMRSTFAQLELRRRTKVYQKTKVAEILQSLLGDDMGKPSLHASHEPREYVVQYAETDAQFARRLCEEEGLYFHFAPDKGKDLFTLADDSTHAPAAFDAKLLLVDDGRLFAGQQSAFHCTASRARSTGKVTLRDYDPKKPALKLEGKREEGTAGEKKLELYEGPGRFRTPSQGERRAEIRLQSLRAEASTISFSTTALRLAPGLRFGMECDAAYSGMARPEGDFVVIRTETRWKQGDPDFTYRVTAVPKAVPYRLPVVTPKPKVHGVHTAICTGAQGEEIHTDASGNVTVRFPWDREGPLTDASSVHVRVLQANLGAALALPRVGWEVVCAFEDGDPDRPYVLGRAYNGKSLPPVTLPANKTVSALQTVSSPGGKGMSGVTFDDAAGRQLMAWKAAFARAIDVANNMLRQIKGHERAWVGGAQKRIVGGDEIHNVKDAWMVEAPSQTAKVDVQQSIGVDGMMEVKIGSEAVLVGGALIEQVGNPADAALEWVTAAVLAGLSFLPGDWGAFVPAVAKIAWETGKAAVNDGLEAATNALLKESTGTLIGAVPVLSSLDALASALEGADVAPWQQTGQPWQLFPNAPPPAATAAAQKAGPGHRITKVNGGMSEAILGAYVVLTPGALKWTTCGASVLIIGGNHSTHTLKMAFLNAGVSQDRAGSINLTCTGGPIAREIKGTMTSTMTALTTDATSHQHVVAKGDLKLKVDGALSLDAGKIVFRCKGSMVTVSSGGVLFKSSEIKVNGKAIQAKKAANA
jgi:type VI secretion system secreted protein VgrG